MTEFGRDHFSFSTKVNVGEFYENRSGGENVSVVSLYHYENLSMQYTEIFFQKQKL